jgi:phosphoglycolate phosphatase
MDSAKVSGVRALIFDLDGTLINSREDLIESVNAMLVEVGRARLPDEVIAGYNGHGAPVLVARALGAAATEEKRGRALQFFLAHYEEHKMDHTCAYPGVVEGLAELSRRRVPMAVLTNKPVRISVRILEALGLAKHFQVIYGGNSFATKKPDPLGAKTILGELSTGATEAMVVGDSEVDMQTARNAGCLAAAVNFGFGVHDRVAYPADIYIDEFGELVALVDGMPK